MKVIEILKLGRGMMKVLQESCIKMEDYKYIEMYEEYKEIVESGGKTSYAVAVSMNSGFTFSQPALRMSVMVISPVSSEEQFMNTLVHEIDHLQTAICDYYDIEKGTEEAAYLQGYIMQRVFRTLR